MTGLSPLIVALDFDSARSAWQLVERLNPKLCRVKVGKELFTASGPELVRGLVDRGFDVFLDLKFHDIPNTVAGAVRAAADLGVWMLNVHASGGHRMMQAAQAALVVLQQRPLLIAVTVLTSFAAEDLSEVGVVADVEQQVLRLTRLALDSGLDGVVCSAQEAAVIRQHYGAGPILVTPGIRPASADADDQRRTVTPQRALAAGSSYLVVGRPITASADPAGAVDAIMSDISYRFS